MIFLDQYRIFSVYHIRQIKISKGKIRDVRMIMLTSKVSFACKVWNFLPFIFYSPSILIHGKSRCFSEESAKICFAGIAALLRQFTDRNLMFSAISSFAWFILNSVRSDTNFFPFYFKNTAEVCLRHAHPLCDFRLRQTDAYSVLIISRICSMDASEISSSVVRQSSKI